MDDNTIVVVHYSAALLKDLTELQKKIVTEAMVGMASKVIGAERTQELVEEIITKRLERDRNNGFKGISFGGHARKEG
jgi:hypothetical protein